MSGNLAGREEVWYELENKKWSVDTDGDDRIYHYAAESICGKYSTYTAADSSGSI
jgi:hypothetical protein